MTVFTTSGTENRMRWDRRQRGFMEVWYATANHAATGSGLWLRYTLTSPSAGDPYCDLWGAWFDPEGKRTFVAKNRYGIDHLGGSNGRDDGALVRIGNAWLSESHLEGEVADGDRRLNWSIDMEPAAATFQHIPAPIRERIEKRISTVCSPNLSVPFTGTVKLDGEAFEFAGEPGAQSHRWGRRHPGTWAWCHCTFPDEPDTVFEGVAARSTLGLLPLPTVSLLFLRYRGEDIAFNDMRWAFSAKGRYEMPTWGFHARNDRWKVIGGSRFTFDRAVQVRYEDPDGNERFCTNSEIADVALELYRADRSGWRHERSLIAIRGAHLEFGRAAPFDGLPVSV